MRAHFEDLISASTKTLRLTKIDFYRYVQGEKNSRCIAPKRLPLDDLFMIGDIIGVAGLEPLAKLRLATLILHPLPRHGVPSLLSESEP
ncbi:unnamed protein product [Nippostrongylus brasiliensis]|uniref:Pyr_redox_2 domain-containing protein n=2 Tax=Nippostrongylus brasiliensis TaxID=27835 RepID=A0A0N4YDE6_NIPBR|nr:unnamed protein product [Nippostrongylus brasiliensis]